jgi:hypothetical protein
MAGKNQISTEYHRNTMFPEYPKTAFATDSHGFSRIKAVKHFVFKKPEKLSGI